MSHKKDVKHPYEHCAPQAERYPGSHVLGMEYTNARPVNYYGNGDCEEPLPNGKWPDRFTYRRTTKGIGK